MLAPTRVDYPADPVAWGAKIGEYIVLGTGDSADDATDHLRFRLGNYLAHHEIDPARVEFATRLTDDRELHLVARVTPAACAVA